MPSEDSQFASEGTPLVQNGETHEEVVVPIKNVDDIDVQLTREERERAITPSQRRFGYMLVGLGAISQSFRATLLHAVLSRSPLPISISFLTMAVVFLGFATTGIIYNKLKPWRILQNRPAFTIWCFRGLSTSFMKYLNFLTLRYVAVGTALTIFATGPSIASVFAFIFLRDPITLYDVGIFLLNIIGVIFVASPGSVATTTEGGLEISGTGISGPLIGSGLLAACACAFFQAATTTMEKSLAQAKIPVLVVLLAIGAGSTLSFLVLIRWDHWAIMVAYPWGTVALFVAALFTYFTHFLLNYAMRFTRPGLTLVVRSLSVPFSFFLGYVLLGEAPTLWEMFGVCLVFSSLVIIGLC